MCERIAQLPVGIGDEERSAEGTSSRLPFRHDVAAVGGAVKLERQARIGMLEHDCNGAVLPASGGTSLIATPR